MGWYTFYHQMGLVNNRQPIQDNGKPFGILVLEPEWCVKTLMRVQGSKLNLIHWITICRLAPMCAMTLDGRTAPGLMVGCNLGRPQSQESNGILAISQLIISDPNCNCQIKIDIVYLWYWCIPLCAVHGRTRQWFTLDRLFFSCDLEISFAESLGQNSKVNQGRSALTVFQTTAGKQQNHKVCLVDGKNHTTSDVS